MSKKKSKKLLLDFDFEATVVEDDTIFRQPPPAPVPAPALAPPVPTKTQDELDAEEEMERRRKLRRNQQQMREQGSIANTVTIVVPPPDSVPAKPTPTIQEQHTTDVSLSASIHDMSQFKGTIDSNGISSSLVKNGSTNKNDNKDNDEEEDDEDDEDDDDDSTEDDGLVLTFISKSKRKQIMKDVKAKEHKTISLEEQLSAIEGVAAETINQAIQLAKDEAEAAQKLSLEGLPDDGDDLEQTQIDVMLWREREAKRLIRDVEELMKHINFS